LADTGALWASGTLRNHPSVGVLSKGLDYWIIDDIIWFKRDAAPLLSKKDLRNQRN
jgi:site-specific DNA-methyltransferase (adenine-specific)